MDNKEYFYQSAEVKKQFIDQQAQWLDKAIALILTTLANGNKLLICGNGWSAADAQHRAAELIGRYKTERRSLPAIALTTDSSILTAIGNDYWYDQVFAKQIEWLGNKGDLLIVISTSGNSTNLIEATIRAKEQWVKTVGLLGKGGWKLQALVDIALTVPSDDTPRIQECHQTIYHTICEHVDQRFSSVS